MKKPSKKSVIAISLVTIVSVSVVAAGAIFYSGSESAILRNHPSFNKTKSKAKDAEKTSTDIAEKRDVITKDSIDEEVKNIESELQNVGDYSMEFNEKDLEKSSLGISE